MKDVKDVVANYRAGIAIAAQARALARPAEEQVLRYEQAFEHIRQIDIATQVVLSEASVPGLQFPFYYAFARHVDKLIRTGLSGESLRIEVALLIALWTGRGLSQTVLERIRDDVFSLGPPEP